MKETVSKNEMEQCCQKSLQARGMAAGEDWESARAVVWLQARGLPGLAACLADLDDERLSAAPMLTPPGGDSTALEMGGNSMLFCGGAVMDYWAMRSRKKETRGTLHNARSLIFLFPFAARWRRLGLLCRLDWGAGRAEFAGDGIVGLTAPATQTEKVLFCCRFVDAKIAADDARADDGLQVQSEHWRRLKMWAAKVLTPAGEADSSQDAGAPGSDND